jgi:hypothetical protein
MSTLWLSTSATMCSPPLLLMVEVSGVSDVEAPTPQLPLPQHQAQGLNALWLPLSLHAGAWCFHFCHHHHPHPHPQPPLWTSGCCSCPFTAIGWDLTLPPSVHGPISSLCPLLLLQTHLPCPPGIRVLRVPHAASRHHVATCAMCLHRHCCCCLLLNMHRHHQLWQSTHHCLHPLQQL